MQLNVYVFFHSQVKIYKDSFKLLIKSPVSCSDEFVIKRLIPKEKEKTRQKERKKERKEEVSYSLY